MAEKQSVKVGPVELRVRFFSENSEWKVLWIENGKSVSKRIYYTDTKEDAMTTMASMAEDLRTQYCKLPSCYRLPENEMDYDVVRHPKRSDSISVNVKDHVLRYYLSITTHSMKVSIAVDFDGIRWDQREITKDNEDAVIEFWSDLENKAFQHREGRVGKIRDDAQEYFRNLYTK